MIIMVTAIITINRNSLTLSLDKQNHHNHEHTIVISIMINIVITGVVLVKINRFMFNSLFSHGSFQSKDRLSKSVRQYERIEDAASPPPCRVIYLLCTVQELDVV